MRGMLKFRQSPKLLSCNNPLNKIRYIIIDLIISHSTDHYIIIMFHTITTIYDKIEPFLCHLGKMKNLQSIIYLKTKNTNYRIIVPTSPTCSLFFQLRTIKTSSEIFGILTYNDFRKFDLAIPSMIYLDRKSVV